MDEVLEDYGISRPIRKQVGEEHSALKAKVDEEGAVAASAAQAAAEEAAAAAAAAEEAERLRSISDLASLRMGSFRFFNCSTVLPSSFWFFRIIAWSSCSLIFFWLEFRVIEVNTRILAEP